MEPSLGRTPVQVSIPVAWGEVDAFQHVSDAVHVRWMETARVAYLPSIGCKSLPMALRIFGETRDAEVATGEQVMGVYESRAARTAPIEDRFRTAIASVEGTT